MGLESHRIKPMSISAVRYLCHDGVKCAKHCRWGTREDHAADPGRAIPCHAGKCWPANEIATRRKPREV